MNEENFLKEYARLNTEQKRAVDTIEGPVMVNAGPGTGKTQILTLRIGNILKQTDVQPENILALTFTNSGVYAMRDRLRSYIGDPAYRVNIFTFHAFAEHIIKNFSMYFSQFEYAKVIDDLQKVKFVEEIIDSHDFEYLVGTHDEYQKVRDITRAIDSLKHEGYSVDQFKKEIPKWKTRMLEEPSVYYARKFKQFNVGDIKPAEQEKIERKIKVSLELAEVYEEYQKKLNKYNLYDFSDMIITVVSEFKKNENLKSELQEQYQYILIDEHQDTNMGQNDLIELLGDAEHLDGHPNIFTVGDEKQSIYRFQGASEQTFKHFNQLYKDITHIDLKENYRSTQTILDASHAVIEHSIEDVVQLNSHTDEIKPIQIGEFSNYKFELLYLAQDIQSKISQGVSPEEIAVLFRSNKHTEDIKNVLAHYKIPFTIFSKNSIFEDIDISNIILLLRVIQNPQDEESLGKALFVNFLGIDGYDIIKILKNRLTYQKQQKKTFFDILNSEEILNEIGVSNCEQIISFAKLIRTSISKSANSRLIDFLKEFLEESGYTSYMRASDLSRDKLLRVDKLFDEIKKHQSQREFNLKEFLILVDSYHAYHLDIENSNPEIEAGVQLMTAHGSKGKEFEYVYLLNTISKNWEKNRGIQGIALPMEVYKTDVHDERRLFYVSMTRAKKGLVITYSKTDWEGKEQEKSRFITEIPNQHIEHIKVEDFEKKAISEIEIFLKKTEEKRTIYDPAFIKDLFIKRGFTVTALNNYLECPIKYFYKNLIQMPSGYSATLEYGNLMHGALEKFFLECKKEEKVLSKDFLLRYFDKEIEHSSFKEKEFKKYKKRGLEALDSWYTERKQILTHVVDIEKKIYKDFTVSTGDVIGLNGKIDKIEYQDSVLGGPITIVDYKTGKAFSKKLKNQKADLQRQLCFYNILLEDYKDGIYSIKEAVLDFLEPGLKAEHERYAMNVSNEEVLELKKTVDTVLKEIISGELLAKGCKKKDCEWCSFHG